MLHPKETKAAYLHLESGNKLDEFIPSGEYHYFKKTNSPKHYLRFTNSEHEDFSSIAWALKASDTRVGIYRNIAKCTVLFFRQYLQQKKGFLKFREELLQYENVTGQPFEYTSKTATELIFTGSIRDANTKATLPYVNIGILNKEWGTVTNRDGVFELELNETHINDTLRISMVGYKSKIALVRNVLNAKGNITIELNEDIAELNEVVVTAKKWKYRILGNRTRSKFLGTGFFYDQLGAEMGIKIHLRGKPTFVNSFNFTISHNGLSAKSLFRLNMYKLNNGSPADNIIKENIIIPVEAKQTGTIAIDLKKYDIVLIDDIVVTLEWIENEGEVKTGEGIYFPLGVFTGGTFVKYSSQGKLKKKKGFGVGFNLDVKY